MKQLGNLVSSDRTTVTSEYAAIDNVQEWMDGSFYYVGVQKHIHTECAGL
jgi:hypothetical protein